MVHQTFVWVDTKLNGIFRKEDVPCKAKNCTDNCWVWRHLDSMQFLTFLHARAPRVSCPEHGVHQVELPWAQATHLFEALAIDVLLAATVSKAADILRISWDEAWHLMERAVQRGQAIKNDDTPSRIGIDEKAIAKRHRYMRIAIGPQQGRKAFMIRTIRPLNRPDPGLEQVAISLHVGVSCEGQQKEKRERSCRYISRPAAVISSPFFTEFHRLGGLHPEEVVSGRDRAARSWDFNE